MATLAIAFADISRAQFGMRNELVDERRLANPAHTTKDRGLSDEFIAQNFEAIPAFNAHGNHLVHDFHEVADIA